MRASVAYIPLLPDFQHFLLVRVTSGDWSRCSIRIVGPGSEKINGRWCGAVLEPKLSFTFLFGLQAACGCLNHFYTVFSLCWLWTMRLICMR